MGVFYTKMPNSRILGAPFIFWNLGTPYFRLQPKIQKSGSRLLLGLLKGFQNCTSQPHSTKTHKKMPWKWASSGPWEWAFARSRTCCWAPWGQVTNPTLQLLSCFNCENLVKNYSIYAHRETHILPPCKVKYLNILTVTSYRWQLKMIATKNNASRSKKYRKNTGVWSECRLVNADLKSWLLLPNFLK